MLIDPSLRLPPLDSSRGSNPIHAAKSRPVAAHAPWPVRRFDEPSGRRTKQGLHDQSEHSADERRSIWVRCWDIAP
jgi:hypothetical protein